MPLYAFECTTCGIAQEQYFTIDSRPPTVPCKCGQAARRIMMIGGVIGDDMPEWMRQPETLGCLQSAGDKNRIRTRGDYNRHLKKHNIAEISAGREI